MRCYCCNAPLNDYEATRKSSTTGQYLDMCTSCYKEVEDVFIEQEEKEEQKSLEKYHGI